MKVGNDRKSVEIEQVTIECWTIDGGSTISIDKLIKLKSEDMKPLDYPIVKIQEKSPIAYWIRHLLTAPRDPGSQSGGGNNLLIYKCMFSFVHLIKRKLRLGPILKKDPRKDKIVKRFKSQLLRALINYYIISYQ